MVNKSQLNGGNPDLAFVDLLVELDRILGVMIIWVIMCTPVRIIVSIARTKLWSLSAQAFCSTTIPHCFFHSLSR